MGLYAWLSPLQIESPSVNVSIYQSPPSNKASSSFSFSFFTATWIFKTCVSTFREYNLTKIIPTFSLDSTVSKAKIGQNKEVA